MWKLIQQNFIGILKLFGFNPKRNFKIQNMIIEIHRYGGLTFNIQKHNNGWIAECSTIKGIIAGNDNPNPTQKEIDEHIKGAIFSAFDIPPYFCDEKLIRSPVEKIKDRELVYG
ncbi:MAG: hypothetical protein L6275_00555 [Candidatus Portnoybacteria bacterium]|nr:hypothetical protein [Candidatus Portnoybacteria bacterium]